MNLILLFARLLLAVTFGIAGIAKLADPTGSRKSIIAFGVPQSLATPLAGLLPFAELLCALALIPLASVWWGAIGVLLLLLSFIAGIAINLIRGRQPDCHCFGQLHSAPIGPSTLIRNAILAAVSGLVVWQGRENPGDSLVAFSGLTAINSSSAALWIAIGALALFELWALVHVLRQNGRLLLRLEAVEGTVGTRPTGHVEAPAPGLPVGVEAPPFSLTDLSGGTVTLQTLLHGGKPLLLLFSEPGCAACEAAIPEVTQWQRDYADRLTIIPISRGVKARQTHHLRNLLLQTDREVAQSYLVQATPAAVLITGGDTEKAGRIASPLSAGIDAIRRLVTHATMPPPVKEGDPVPSLRLPDLSGNLFDLAQLQSRRILMLFWSPTCGFCTQMLEDLHKWEHNRREDSPELVVVAAGEPDENRKQGFRSRVLLDPDYAVSQVFNSGGTPSAVLLDHGRVASQVVVGAQAVLELAGNP